MQNTRIREAENRAASSLEDLAKALSAYTTGKRNHGEDCAPQPAFSFAPAKTMRDAAEIASGRCAAWRIDGEDDVIDRVDGLFYIADMQDSRLRLALSDDKSYYLVTEDGSIGLTTDGCEHIDWIFLKEDL